MSDKAQYALVVLLAVGALSYLLRALPFLLFGGRLLLPFFIKDGDVALYPLSLRAMQLYAFSYLVLWTDGTQAGFMAAVERPGTRSPYRCSALASIPCCH